VNPFISQFVCTPYDGTTRKRKEGAAMLKILVGLILGTAVLLASAVWSGTVIESKPIRLETISAPNIGSVRFVP
jgi:hypothetical protein